MKVLIINATMREQTSYNFSRVLAEMIAGEEGLIYEVFLPKNLPDFCTGCYRCITSGESSCPHSKHVNTILAAIDDSQVFIIASPVCGRNVPASLKNLFDHLYFQWIYHRPKGEMWNRQGVILTSCSIGGQKHAQNCIRHNLENWGMAKIHTLNFKTQCRQFDEVLPYEKIRMGKSLEKLTAKILMGVDKKPGLYSRLLFLKGRLYQKLKNKNKIDTDYWGEKGWLDVIRPWYVKRIRK
jgi:multimeric flavodoxin WrbA